MIELQTVTTKAKNPSTNEFQDVTWGGINVLSTSGTTNYNNLTNKPTINGVTVQGSLTTGDLLITAADVGALPSGTKYGADFALSIDSQTFVVTAQLKDQDGNNLGQAKTIDLPLETMVVSGSYDDTTQKIILTLKNGQTVEFSVADLVSGLQSEITLNNKLDADLVSDVSSENKFVTTAEKTAWNAKQDAIYDLSTIRSGAAAGATAVQPTDMNTALAAKQDTLTFDTVPTENSQNPVTSGGVAASQTAQDAEIAVIANAGAKNDFDIENLIKSAISENVTYSLSGYSFVASSNGRYARVSIPYKFKAGTTVFSTVVSEYSISGGTMYIRFATQSSSIGQIASEIEITNNGQYQREITVNADTDGFVVYYMNGSTNTYVNSAVFTNNMIRPASITDSTFVPYAKTNVELTGENASQQAEIDYAVNAGVKNLLPDKHAVGNAVEANGFRFTPQSDGGIKIESIGTHSANGDYYIQGNWGNTVTVLDLSDDTYAATISCETTVSGISLRIFGASSIPIVNNIYLNNETNFTGEVKFIFITVISTAVIPSSGIIVYPMIRPASITDSTFVPYAKTNRELTVAEAEDRAALIEQVDEGPKNLLNLNTDFTTYENKGITYKNNSDGTIKVSGTSSSGDSYITLYDKNTDNLFGIQKGKTVVIRSTSDDVSINLIYKKSGGGYGLTVYGYKSSPSWFTVPSDFAGFLLRIGVPRNGTTVNENVGGMICTAANYAVSPIITPYLKPYSEIGRLGYHIETVALNSVTISKSTNGIFYTSAIDASDKFDLLLGATLNNFVNLQSNISIMPVIKPADKTYSLWICDSTNPQTLPVSAASQVKVVLYGIVKG